MKNTINDYRPDNRLFGYIMFSVMVFIGILYYFLLPLLRLR